MNQVANVVYAYSPKNDDELELSVGDKIEVIGFEEEGWWKGKLKGRIGVFPSNFVQVIETGPTPPPSVSTPHQNNNSVSNTNKLTAIFGNKASKISLSSNSLNSNNSNSNNSTSQTPSNNNNDISTANINNNLTMNNTQDNSGLGCNDDASNTSSERRQPKPVRAMGYGDIFAAAKTKPLPADPTYNLSANASDRSSTSYAGSLQKQIPKKPPPPTPISSSAIHPASDRATPTTDNTNGNFAGEAPALPPKPVNQYSPHIQHSVLHLPPVATVPQLQVREQAKVIYAYQPTNDDELAIEVGDIIDIIDKNIEDQGWWKGELRGRTGVFPDNFVKLIEAPKTPQPPAASAATTTTTSATTNGPSQNQEWLHRGSHHNMPPIPNFNANQNNDSNRIKSLFASTPKGFSKELESNLEKHNSQASFLSLKRNKLQHPAVSVESELSMNETNKLDDLEGQLETSATKLNHITANRAKGPNRRPPSNLLNKRNQLDQQVNSSKLNGTVLASLPISSSSHSLQDPLSSLPAVQANNIGLVNASTSPSTPKTNDVSSTNTRKISPVVDSILDSTTTPKTSQRFTQMSAALDKSKTSSTTTTPPWMVELKKAHADRKRDTPQVLSSGLANTLDDEQVAETPSKVTLEPVIKAQNHHQHQLPPPPPPLQQPLTAQQNQLQPQQQQQQQLQSQSQPQPPNPATVHGLSSAQYDNLIKMISKSVGGEIAELREELQRLKVDVQELNETKKALEVMKIEIKTCQSATESQKKYIRDLVNNLADERKKISAMQVEIDRNLK